jgi:hypothetical protein
MKNIMTEQSPEQNPKNKNNRSPKWTSLFCGIL